MAFSAAESCGRCTFCRVGTLRMLEVLERLCHGQARAGDLERLEQLAGWVQRGSLCGLGKTAPNPVLSTLAHFRDEYEAHVVGRCPAGQCRDLIRYSINERCIGCTKCAQRCASGALTARPYERHVIEAALCRRCGVCRAVCPAQAVEVH
jgi:Pyruvate/2-oxoacid:ferredoxin oxidoreductase delta subunit